MVEAERSATNQTITQHQSQSRNHCDVREVAPTERRTPVADAIAAPTSFLRALIVRYCSHASAYSGSTTNGLSLTVTDTEHWSVAAVQNERSTDGNRLFVSCLSTFLYVPQPIACEPVSDLNLRLRYGKGGSTHAP